MIDKLFLCTTLLLSDVNPEEPGIRTYEKRHSVQALQQSEGEAIFRKLLLSFDQGADAVISLFHKDVLIEYPYAPSLGTASKLNYTEYHNYLIGALPGVPNLVFSDIRVYETGSNAYAAETHAESIIPATGKVYKQNYVMFFTLKAGKISMYREYWNPMAGLEAFGGLEDLQKNFKKQN